MIPSFIGYRTHIAIIVSILGGLGVLEKLGLTVEATNQLVEQILKFADLGIAIGSGVYALWLNHKNHVEMENVGLR